MVAPTAPTLDILATEGLLKAGYATTASDWATLLTRAKNNWMEEIKNDIYVAEKQLISLQTEDIRITEHSTSKYSNPSDFGEIINLTLMDGRTGTFQAGSSGYSWVLSSNSSSDIIGKEIIVYDGTKIGTIGQIRNFDIETMTADVALDAVVTPAEGDSYMIVDTKYDLIPSALRNYDSRGTTVSGTPIEYSLTGDALNGGYILYPTPYRASGIPWVIKIRYYADLTRLDLVSTTLSTVYRRWRNVFIQGVFAKCLQYRDDTRYPAEIQTYYNALMRMVSRDKFGVDSEEGLTISVSN